MRLDPGKILPWILGVLALIVIASAVRIGTADLLCKYAASRMAQWSKPGDAAAALVDASRVLATARWLAPDNPDVYANMARLAMLRAAGSGSDDAARMAVLRGGVELARRAIALRPVSPYGWATLLALKRELGEYDVEFRRSLERTTTLGPWEPELQVTVADAGLAAWASLPEAERGMVGRDVLRGMKRQPGAMFAVAQAHLDACPAAQDNAGCTR